MKRHNWMSWLVGWIRFIFGRRLPLLKGQVEGASLYIQTPKIPPSFVPYARWDEFECNWIILKYPWNGPLGFFNNLK